MNTKRQQLDFLRQLVKALRAKLDLILLVIVVSGFVLVAAQRLGAAPLPDSDESMTLQVPYEMLYRGKLAFPMYSFLGGNIQNAWHSYTPVFFAMLTGFMKVFGWGLTQGRAFNLVFAVLLLLMVYLVGRKLADRWAGLTAVVLLTSDAVFFARSRLARNDYSGAMFAVLAFYLYEFAAESNRKWCYFGSGVAAGMGVMCHTNVVYILPAILVLMLLNHGWRLIGTARLYVFAVGAIAPMAYEIVFDIIDYKNFILQNRLDNVHFRVFERLGWWNNLLEEPGRYIDWYFARAVKFAPDQTLLHVFLYSALIAFIYLSVCLLTRRGRNRAVDRSRTSVLVVTLVAIIFFAAVTQRKVTLYVVHLAPWLALCVGMLLSDGADFIDRLKHLRVRSARFAHGCAVIASVLGILLYGYALAKQDKRYLKDVNNPELASFEEIKSALRSVVPDGVCPVTVGNGFLWLAFPEHDQCFFAFMEARPELSLGLEGKDYALLVRPKFLPRQRKLVGDVAGKYYLLGELRGTAYGTLQVYYTGSDPGYLGLAPRRYYFFGRQRGHVSDEQVAAGRVVWTADADELDRFAHDLDRTRDPQALAAMEADISPGGAELTALCTVELEARTAYQVIVDANPELKGELIVADESTGAWIQSVEMAGKEGEQLLEEVFKTSTAGRVRLALRSVGERPPAAPISRVSIRKITAISPNP